MEAQFLFLMHPSEIVGYRLRWAAWPGHQVTHRLSSVLKRQDQAVDLVYKTTYLLKWTRSNGQYCIDIERCRQHHREER